VGVELDEAAKYPDAGTGLESLNYYELLQISPNAQASTIQRIYRYLAARYHPDNPETGDPERFLLLTRAYKTLSDPERRASYDAELRRNCNSGPDPEFTDVDFLDGVEGEMNRRLAVLAVLYRRCRANINEARLSLLQLEAQMGFPREYLDFTTWYLRSKKYITKEDNSDFSLTVLGVDFVEANYDKLPLLRKLLKSGVSPSPTKKSSSDTATPEGSGSRVMLPGPDDAEVSECLDSEAPAVDA
jgi:curved DNA-binding protein CbpA